jgi:hypothetical protein
MREHRRAAGGAPLPPLGADAWVRAARRAWLITAGTVVLTFATFLLVPITHREAWAWIGVGLWLAGSLWSFSARCPRCRVSVFRRTVRLGQVEITYWGLPAPACSSCGLR